jgi:hypothetical protein
MSTNQFDKLIAFLERLDDARIPYTMEHSREDAIMILAFAPGEYWEIEFLQDGEIDIERYRSDGKIHDESVLQELFDLCSDEEASAEEPVNQNDAKARKG